jgi:hypothetical protein
MKLAVVFCRINGRLWGLVYTEEGAAVGHFSKVPQNLDETEEGMRAFAKARAEETGRVVITVQNARGEFLLPRVPATVSV